MSRTPLFREVRRVFRLARAAERRGAETVETIELQRESARRAAWTRRELLGAGLAVGAGAAPVPASGFEPPHGAVP